MRNVIAAFAVTIGLVLAGGSSAEAATWERHGSCAVKTAKGKATKQAGRVKCPRGWKDNY